MAGVTFTKSAAEKIGKAVAMVLNPTRDRAGARTTTYANGGEFLAMILGGDASGQRFTFHRVSPDPERLHPDAFTIDGDAMQYALEGDAVFDAAREANGARAVPIFSIVKMIFTGYDTTGDPTFIFFYNAPEPMRDLPPHDHRSNFHGGFAFSVFHPGTGLPQSPFAI